MDLTEVCESPSLSNMIYIMITEFDNSTKLLLSIHLYSSKQIFLTLGMLCLFIIQVVSTSSALIALYTYAPQMLARPWAVGPLAQSPAPYADMA